MKRFALVAAAALAAAACGASSDPCADAPAACLGVRVTDGPEVDQLRLVLAGAARADAVTPSTPGPSVRPPITTAIYLPPTAAGSADLVVVGFLGGARVGRGTRTVTLTAGQRQTVELSLRDLTNDDLASPPPTDGGAPDLSTPIDLAVRDLATRDLSGPDLAGVAPRHVFLLTARTGALGTLDALDAACTSEGAALGAGNRPFKAIVNYPSNPPRTRITLGQAGRPIVLPSGSAVATDDTFWSPTHTGAINELASGSANPTPCVWAHFNANGDGIVSMVNCMGWTTSSSGVNGSVADPTTTQISWSFSGTLSCNLSCHVYCIEQ